MPLLRNWEKSIATGCYQDSLLAELLAVGRSVNPVGDLCNRWEIRGTKGPAV
jgi:hypothetical protein